MRQYALMEQSSKHNGRDGSRRLGNHVHDVMNWRWEMGMGMENMPLSNLNHPAKEPMVSVNRENNPLMRWNPDRLPAHKSWPYFVRL